MRILTRYLLRAHVGPFLFALAILTGILFINTVAKRITSLVGKGLPVRTILEVMALSLPHIIALTLPMAVLVAVLYAFSQLAAENEVTALKASGVNLLRMLVPLLVTAVLLTGGMIWFNHAVLPETNHRLAQLMVNISSKSPTLLMRPQVINYVPTQDYSRRIYIRAGDIDDASGRLTDVVIYDVSSAESGRTMYADSGLMAFNQNRTDLFLTLYNGYMNEIKRRTPADLDRVFFTRQMMQLKDVGTTFQRSMDDDYRSDREMNLTMLATRIDSTRETLASVRRAQLELQGGATPAGVAGDSVALAERAKSLQNNINSLAVEWHKKFAIPIACIIFVLIGAPIAVRFPRGGAGMVIAVSLAVFGIYYMSLIGGEALGDRGKIPPFLGPWAPNFLFGALGILAVRRIGRETASSRGGGWDDLRRSVIGLFSRRRARAA
ncbi:MAG TPA: LptF/LptG family permease [Longimicrobiales bacterium]